MTKNRILALLLALLMVVSLIPSAVFATETDGNDIYSTGDDTGIIPGIGTGDDPYSLEDDTENTPDIGTGDDPYSVDPDTEIIPGIGTGEDCKCGLPGGTHAATCPNYVCPDCGELGWHEACPENDSYSVGPDTEIIPILCPVCGTENCAVEHVLCDNCGKYETGNDPCTCAVSPNYSAHVGRYAQLVEASFAYLVIDNGDLYNENSDADALIFYYYEFEEETIFRITDWYVDDGTTALWYRVEFCSGGILEESAEYWPTDPWILQNYLEDGWETNSLEFVNVTCPICGEEGCTKEHVQCGHCGEYDCELSHTYCGTCRALDCIVEHIYCVVCMKFDCGITHEKTPEEDHTPLTAPVIPDDPQLPGEYDVAIVDENGDLVTVEGGFLLGWNEKASLSAWSALGEEVSYQWQILVADGGNEFWVDIAGQTDKGLLFSRAMLMSAMDADGCTRLRCVTGNGTETRFGDAIPVTVLQDERGESTGDGVSLLSMRSFGLLRNSGVALAADEPEYVSITIKYLKAESFVTGAEEDPVTTPYIATIPLGSAFNQTIVAPTITGYAPFRDVNGDGKLWTGEDSYDSVIGTFVTDSDPGVDESASEITLSLDAVNENLVFYVYYLPIKVNIGVRYYFQNLNNDYYTEDVTRYHADTMRTGTTVTEEYLTLHAGDTSGFERMYHQPADVAADGSTVFECFYDRNYYLINFSLSGGYGVEPIYSRYGTNVMVSTPIRAGYKFNGWDLLTTDTNGDGTMDTGDGVADTLPITVPAENRMYRAIWVAEGEVSYTVAYWLVDDANDEYHIDDTFIGSAAYSAPADTEIVGSNYPLTNDTPLCGLEEHAHSDDCRGLVCTQEGHVHSIDNGCYTLTCTEEEHTHGDADCACTIEEHTHGDGNCIYCAETVHGDNEHNLECYTSEYEDLEAVTGNNWGNNNARQAYNNALSRVTGSNGTVYRVRRSNAYYNFFYYDAWYYLGSGNAYSGILASVSDPSNNSYTSAKATTICHTHSSACCTLTEHTHGNGTCLCGKDEHTHTIADCYNFTCTKDGHVHDDGCYENLCGKLEHTHGTDCPTFDTTHLVLVRSDTASVNGDGTTVLNVYYTYRKYTLRFYYARNSDDDGLQVVGGTVYPFGYDSGSYEDTVDTLLSNVTAWGAVEGLEGNKTDLADSTNPRGYTFGTHTVGDYTYYYLQFTATYGACLEDLWPIDIFKSVTVNEAHSSHGGSADDYCPIDNAYFSAWCGEYKVKYSQDHGKGDGNQTIKGLYMYLDDEILYQSGWNNDTYYTELDDGSRLVNYLGFWDNGYNINWSRPKLFRYQLWVSPTAGQAGTTYGEFRTEFDGTSYGNGEYADYVQYRKPFNTYDDSSPVNQTPPSLKGYTYLGYQEDHMLELTEDQLKEYLGEDAAADMMESADTEGTNSYIINYFYSSRFYALTVNNQGSTIASAPSVAYGTSLSDLMDRFTDENGDPLFTDDKYTPPYPGNLEAGGYSFDRWYSASGCVEGTEVDIAMDTMPAGNLALYAKWSPVIHKVNFFYHYEYLKAYEEGLSSIEYNGTTYDFTTNGGWQTHKVKHSSTMDAIDVPTATYQFPVSNSEVEMKFVGWFYFEDGQKKAYSPTEIPIRGDLNVYAEWRDKNTEPYRISYVLKGTQTKIAADTFGYSSAGILRTFVAKAGYPNNELYDLSSSGGKNYNVGHFPLTASHSIVVQPEDDLNWMDPQINLYSFEYVEATHVKYTVRHVVVEGGAEKVVKEYVNYTDNAIVTEKFEDLTDYGYPDYVADAFYKELIIAVMEDPDKPGSYIGAPSNVITFRYTISTDSLYAIHHMVEKIHAPEVYADAAQLATVRGQYNIDGTGGYEDYGHRIEQYAPTGSNVEIQPITISGFTLDRSHVKYAEGGTNMGTLTDHDGTYTITVTKVGTEVYFFYTREDYKYTVHYYKFNTTELIDSEGLPSVTESAAYGSTVSKTAPMYAADKAYKLVSDQTKSILIRQEENQNEIIFYYTPIQYQVEYVAVPPEGGSLSVTKEVRGSDEFSGSTATASKNYEFVGWFIDPELTNEVAVDTTAEEYDKTTGQFVPLRQIDSNGDPITEYVFYAKFNLLAADFTIKRSNAEAGQVFVYRVENADRSLSIDVTIVGNGSVTIADLPFGDYTVTQLNGWSWRYKDAVWTGTHDADTEFPVFEDEDDPIVKTWLSGVSALLPNKYKEEDE